HLAHEVEQLGVAMPRQREHRYHADRPQRAAHLEELEDVRHVEHHAIPRREAETAPTCGLTIDAFDQLPVGAAPRTADDRDRVGRAPGHVAEGVDEREATPHAAAAVVRHDLGRPRAGGWGTLGHSAASANTGSTPGAASNPKARRMVRSLAAVSSNSCSGTEPSTMPAPAKSRVVCRPISAQRIAIAHSPSPRASLHPTKPQK